MAETGNQQTGQGRGSEAGQRDRRETAGRHRNPWRHGFSRIIKTIGKPTGVPVVIMAMTHAELQEVLVVRESHAIDEVSIWMQIIGHSN